MSKYKALTDEEAELASCHLDVEELEYYDEMKDTIRHFIMSNLYDLSGDLEEFTQSFAGETTITDTMCEGNCEYEIEIKIKRLK